MNKIKIKNIAKTVEMPNTVTRWPNSLGWADVKVVFQLVAILTNNNILEHVNQKNLGKLGGRKRYVFENVQ